MAGAQARQSVARGGPSGTCLGVHSGMSIPGSGTSPAQTRFANRRGLVALMLLATAACSGAPPAPPEAATPPTAASPTATAPSATASSKDEPIPPTASPYDALPPAVRKTIGGKFVGDFDALVARRALRVGVTFNRTHYFIDKGQERGLTYEVLKAFERDLNEDLKTGNLKVHIVIVPMQRDQLYPALAGGEVDLVAAMITVTPEREKLVAFSEPTRSNVRQVVVSGPGAPPVATVDDLAGQEVLVRKGSVYEESLTRLNVQLKAKGRPAVIIVPAPVALEDDDILEMVNAGLAPLTVVDDYLAEFWARTFTDTTVHRDVALREGGTLAVAFRKENPELRRVVNTWLRKHQQGDGFRNVVERRYLQNTTYAKNAATDSEHGKLLALREMFKKYGAQYDMDYLLMAAQGYQESTLDQGVKSPVGAIGVMQVMPPTGKELQVGDIHQVEPNIHAGVKYMRFMIDHYFKDEPMDNLNKALMAFAAYNAGPGRVRQLRREAAERGLDPNVWFGNVERVASERIGRETVTYVSNIYKYYIAYRLLADRQARLATAKAEVARRH